MLRASRAYFSGQEATARIVAAGSGGRNLTWRRWLRGNVVVACRCLYSSSVGGGGGEPTELQPTLRPVGQRFACMWYWKIVRRIFVVRSIGGLAQRGLGMRTVYEKELAA